MPRYFVNAYADYGYVLVLNPMMGNTENGQQFGPFPTRQALLDFYNAEKVEPYSDEGPNMFEGSPTKMYRKTFRKGGPLEWMNPWDQFSINKDQSDPEWGMPDYHGHGIHEVLLGVDGINIINKVSDDIVIR